jgi:hypothetical protein
MIELEADSAVAPSPVATRCVPSGMVFDSPGFRHLLFSLGL